MTTKKPSATAVATLEKRPAAKMAARMSASAPAADDEATKATTLRLDPVARAGLEMLRRATGSTLNKLVNDAVLMYVSARSAQLDALLRDGLQRIADYRRSDPYFERAIDAIVAAETAHAKDDPTEGRMVANYGSGDARDSQPRVRRRRR